jgi:hemolysin activation/secretion protein
MKTNMPPHRMPMSPPTPSPLSQGSPPARHTPRVPALGLCALATATALLCGPGSALAQATGAGQLLEETRRPPPPALPPKTPPRVIEAPVRPAIAMPEGVSVTVSGFRVTGNRSFPADVLEALVQPWVGKQLDIRGLNEAAGALTRHYQSNGHLLSYAYLPAQRVGDGVIELAVLEGRLEGVQIVTAQDVRLRDEVVQAHTDSLVGPGALTQDAVERKLLLLNDIPGVTARGAFTPGATTGGAEMVVSVAEDEPLEVRAELNNHGSKSTGIYRAGLTLHFRDLFGWGDSTTARGFASDKGSLVAGSLGTSVPVGGDGWRLGASLSRLQYQLVDTFKNAGALGTANTLGFDASYPLRRSSDANLSARAGLDFKRLHDRTIALGSVDKRNDTGELGIAFDFRDPLGGLSAGSATATLGQLRVSGSARQEWHKLNGQFARQQAIAGPVSLYARVSGQTTGASNLDSSEKLGLGGAGAVRAYPSGEASVDQGALASLELRYSLDLLGGSVVASLFHDYGSGKISRGAGGAAGNEPELNGTGFGLSWSGSGLGLNASLAWRGSRVPTTDGGDPRPRLFLQMSYTP